MMFIFYAFTFSIFTLFSVLACDHCDGHDCMETRAHVRGMGGGASGRWVDTVTPKRGWRCSAIRDEGAPTTQCEMCEREDVRYVHTMSHGRFGTLDVGCICAGYMDGASDTEAAVRESVQRARQRQQILENRDARRRNFPDLAGWDISRRGNLFINYNVGGQRINVTMVKSRYDQYSAIIDGDRIGRWFTNVRDAKLAVFDIICPRTILYH